MPVPVLHMRYRPEIDGMRAIALMQVICYHAGFPFAAGGFVGVDVFFVISGYLITAGIVGQLDAGKFSLASFYDRRVRRILPALIVVAMASVPFAWSWLYADEIRKFARSLLAVAGFYSNFHFRESSGYFDGSAEYSPLIHTWSLAVEEQFYLIWPFVILGCWRFARPGSLKALAGLALSSLLLAVWASSYAPSFAFYLLPTRLWELALGGMVGVHLHQALAPRPRPWLMTLATALGLCMVVGASVFFNERTPTPGLLTLIPTLGAALFILCAQDASGPGKILSGRLFVRTGLISYSAYLLHQPIFAFARLRSIDEPGPQQFAMLTVLVLSLASLLWYFIERPARLLPCRTRTVALASVLGLAAMAMSALWLQRVLPRHAPSPYEKQVRAFTAREFQAKARHGTCFLDSATQSHVNFAAECQGVSPNPTKVLLWGDSHAAALAMGLRALSPGFMQYTASGCPPTPGRVFVSARNCADINDFVLKELAHLKPDVVVLDASWYAYGDQLPGFVGLVSAIHSSHPGAHVVVVGNVPIWVGGLPLLFLKHQIPLTTDVHIQNHGYPKMKAFDQAMKRDVEAAGATFVSALDVFCDAGTCRASLPFAGEASLTAFDYGHLTEAGALVLARQVLAVSTASQ